MRSKNHSFYTTIVVPPLKREYQEDKVDQDNCHFLKRRVHVADNRSLDTMKWRTREEWRKSHTTYARII